MMKHMKVLPESGIKRRPQSESIKNIPVSNLPKLEIRMGRLVQRMNNNVIVVIPINKETATSGNHR